MVTIRQGTDTADSVSEGSDIDIGQGWSVSGQTLTTFPGCVGATLPRCDHRPVSRGLIMTPLMTSLIILSSHLSRPGRCACLCISGLMISIVMTDAGDRRGVTAWFPRQLSPCSCSAWVRTVCLNGPCPGSLGLVTTNTAGFLLSQDSLSHVIANRETDHHFVSITTFNFCL